MTGQKTGPLTGRSRRGGLRYHVEEDDACEAARRRPTQVNVPPPDGKNLGEGDPPMHAVRDRADWTHVGAPVIGVAARNIKVGDYVGRLRGEEAGKPRLADLSLARRPRQMSRMTTLHVNVLLFIISFLRSPPIVLPGGFFLVRTHPRLCDRDLRGATSRLRKHVKTPSLPWALAFCRNSLRLARKAMHLNLVSTPTCSRMGEEVG